MQTNQSNQRCVAAALLVLAGLGAGARAQTLTDLGLIPGGLSAMGTGVSANGTMACGFDDSFTTRAFRWSAPGTHTSLGLVPGGNLWSYGQGISGDGLTVVGWGDNPGGSRPFKWTQAGGMINLGTIPGGSSAAAFATDATGTAVVGQSDGPGFGQRAMRWTPIGGMQTLGVLPGGNNSYAYGVSGNGSVIVGYGDTPAGDRAFCWQSSGMINLGTLPTGTSSRANGVSRDGVWVVGAASVAGGVHAFRWHVPFGPMQDLGAVYSNNAAAIGANADGSAVVGFSASVATLWTPNAGMRDLNIMLSGMGVNLTNWQLNRCTGVSDDNTALVGTGKFNGIDKAWIVRGMPCLDGPLATSNPSGYLACAGSTNSMQASGSGTGTVTYQWRKNNNPIAAGPTGNGSTYQIVSNATTSTLTIVNQQVADTGSYHCVVTNQCGTAPTTAASVTIASAPTWFGFTFGQFGCIGSTFQIGNPSTSNISMSYVWTFGANTIVDGVQPSGSTITGQGTPTLTITNAQPGDSGTYYGYCSNICGSAPVYSQEIAVSSGIGFAEHPLGISTCPGGGTTFSASAPGANGYQWQFKDITGAWVNLTNPFYWDGVNNIFFLVSGATTPTLNVSNVLPGPMMNLRFRCAASQQFGCPGVSNEAAIFIAPPPVVTQHPPSVLGCADGTHQMTMNYSSFGPVGLFWQVKDGLGNWQNLLDGVFTDPSTGMSFTVFGAGNTTINISNITLGTHVNPIEFYCLVGGICSNAATNSGYLQVKNAKCQPADIACDDGTPLVPCSLDVDCDNTGVNEGDYNAFFQGYFNAAAYCDIACDDGTPLPPFGPGNCDNNGVNEGDYNCFFQFFFNGCP